MIVTLLLFVLILGITVFVHESGHFLFAKLVGVHVYEFSLGFGPRIFKHIAKGKTEYSIRAIPLGGFVSLAGEETDVDLKKNRGKNLQDKNIFQRFLVMFMGVGFNFIFAFLVLFVIGLIFGAPNLDPVISGITENSPASVVGLETGDKIISINEHKVKYLDDISLYITLSNLDKNITIEVEKKDDAIKKYTIVPEKVISSEGKESYLIGISLSAPREIGIGYSLEYAFKQECALFKQMFVVLGSLFTGKLSVSNLSGPVGIYSVVGTMQKQGISSLMYLVALLSINVGIINLLPFPAFDGGRILFLIIEKLKGSPINPKIENTIHSIGFILLMILMVYITFNDILKLF